MSNFFRNIHPLLRRNKRPEKYDDTNFAVLNALNYELTQAEQETIASKIQSSLESATDTYLDTWGDWFGVYRKDGWDDEYYRARIIRELLLKRGTIPAIIDALVDFLNDNDAVVQIYEPWRNIFYTNKSKLNGDDHLMGYYYRFAIIDISIDRPFPPEIVEIIKAFKPAGVLFYLRLDTSLAKNKTTVESPYVYLDVTNKTELEFLNGLYYDLRGNINLSDQRTQVVGNNIFHTNNSKLNGEDVLAGAFNHGRGYIHLASTTLLDYTPKATDSMSNLKTTLGEAGSDMYNQTKEKDGRTASIQVPATKNVHTLYSNSTDFGNYDYSGNPNLAPNLDFSKFSGNGITMTEPLACFKDHGTYLELDSSEPSVTNTSRNIYVPNCPPWIPGNTYVMTVPMMVSDDFDDFRTAFVCKLKDGTALKTLNPPREGIGTWQNVTGVFTVPKDLNVDTTYLQIWQPKEGKGKLYIGYNIKIERVSSVNQPATPYQPNLLNAPYYLGKTALNDNLIESKSYSNSNYLIGAFPIKKSIKNGEKVTFTLKGTKPNTKQFGLYIQTANGASTEFQGHLVAVEGLPNTWSWTGNLKIMQTTTDTAKVVIYQLPPAGQVPNGSATIEWAKLEKGDTRTPNIDSYDYVGSLIEDTETPTLDPTKYTWTVNGDVTNKKAYMVFDIKTFIEENYATEFEKLVADLGEDQALNTVFENFNISTALKALVSPSSPINFSVELYDFSTSAWHKLNTDSLDLRMRTFNLVANRITDYLNDYKLLFVRYVFDNETDKDVTVELDMLNVLFKYRLGDGYSLGLQSTVECLSEIPLKGITLSSDSVEVATGETAKVTPTLVPASATNTTLEWEITDTKIATVDTSGNITGVAIGETTLTVYGEDRTISATCSVSVKARHTLYSNSTDFGEYDYSGNPNVAVTDADTFKSGAGGTLTYNNGEYTVLMDGTARLSKYNTDGKNSVYLEDKATYTISCEMYVGSDYTGNVAHIFANYAYLDGGYILLQTTRLPANAPRDTWIIVKGTSTMNYQGRVPKVLYFTWQTDVTDVNPTGTLKMRNMKIERGEINTPYQPNLLNAPYYLGKTALNENLIESKSYSNSNYLIGAFPIKKSIKNGEKVTFTLKGTKPNMKQFGFYIQTANGTSTEFQGHLVAVEGLPNTWSWTGNLKIMQTTTDTAKVVIYQLPPTEQVADGSATIEWAKLEKGDTRTPNIDSYTYHGTILTTSEEPPKDPNVYTWSSI
ncbi:hypothetical protein EFP01_064 [Enterococcus phage EFP01]|uniref:BIG2 domain-containing protein n=1 Tax=Enterococcus phage EFP01 TaxID=1926594 RepID=A0A288TYH2_9CAUD|nr:hypothetical protein HOR47_gp064 [Enterococcus phage EFP01]APZ81991.1 hypothetical protein EFP01_064 [Enterococcus phage EFP01]